MSLTSRSSLLRAAVLAASVAVLIAVPAASPAADVKPIRDALDRGVEWLKAQQNPDGGYGPFREEQGARLKDASDVGVTALVLYAIARHPKGLKAESGPFVSKAVDFLTSKQQPDGGFYDPRDPSLPNYKTSVVVLALTALDRLKYAPQVQKAQGFIKKQQFDEEDGLSRTSPWFGGAGYGSKPDAGPDLSNSQLGADALVASGLSGSDELWVKLVVFVSRCQNSPTVDPVLQELKIGTTGDGGARYAPAQTRGPEETLDGGVRVFSSYGSMTYAALKTLLYANVKKSDPRVQQAFAWISKSFTVKENPGMATRKNPRAGLDGLYYYYHTMAKTLSVYGERVIVDSRGAKHRWARELADQLVALQQAEPKVPAAGFWVNTSDRWYENIAQVDTAFAMAALATCLEDLEAEGAAAESK